MLNIYICWVRKSDLVNHLNVVKAVDGQVAIVPKAGMRVMQDNFPYCKRLIMEMLENDG